MRFRRIFLFIVFLLFCLLINFAAPQKALALEPGFNKTLVAGGLDSPSGFAEAPDGRIFVIERAGTVKIVKNGTVLSQPFLNLPVDNTGERGLLGIAFDPSFDSNHYVYFYYVNATPLEIRVSRFVANGDSASPGSEQILLRSTQELGIYHMAGTVRFGPDGKLWISVGNNGNNSNSQDLSNIHGKILRINSDGSIPQDNPFVGIAGQNPAIWSYGLRNPFRFNFLPNGAVIMGDVGDNIAEEINIGAKGGNFGWPFAEGPCSGCSSINPTFYYQHNNISAAVVGGFVYNTTGSSPFPSEYKNTYFFGDYARGFIREIHFDSNWNYVSDEDFDTEAGTVVDLQEGKDGSLYFVNIYPGELYKITYTTDNIAPTAKIKTSSQGGFAPLTVNFVGDGSTDAQNLPLFYKWDFGDGSTSLSQNPTHTYIQNGQYIVKLIVNNGNLDSSPATANIVVGDTAPTPTITAPANSSKYNAGDTISYSANATDEVDGELPPSAYSWIVNFHHGTHIHPFLGPITDIKNGTFTIPNTGEASSVSYYEIILKVTNSKGLSKSVSTNIYPNTVNITLSSNTAGLIVTLDGVPHATPYSFEGVVGFTRTIDVPTPQTLNGASYAFDNWSDNGTKTHNVTISAQDETYQANFIEAGVGAGSMHFRIRQIEEDGSVGNKFINGATVKVTDISGSTVYSSTTSKNVAGQDGWADFDNLQAGTYAIMANQQGYSGFWHQTDCNGTGTSANSTIQNQNTQNQVGAFKTPVVVRPQQITWCQDLGLKEATKGRLALRTVLLGRTSQSANGYLPISGINGVTVKITDLVGHVVVKTAISQAIDSVDGWAKIPDIPAGTYGVLAYKDGFTGFWHQVDCSGLGTIDDSNIRTENTENQTAAWDNNVVIAPGATTYCHDLGLKGYGKLHFRVREFDDNGISTGNFINGATAKLIDSAGNTVYAETVSKTIGNEDGWVFFDNVDASNYTGALVYKSGYTGYWKQNECNGSGISNNATIQNQNTDNQIAGWQSNDVINPNQTTWCRDIGLKNPTENKQKGSIRFRIRLVDSSGNPTSQFINGANAKLVDKSTNQIVADTISSNINGNDGWVLFENVNIGKYVILAGKDGYIGGWRQTNCDGAGTTQNVRVGNFATQPDITVSANQITWCSDLGLSTTVTTQSINPTTSPTPIPTVAPAPTATPTPASVGSYIFQVKEYDKNGMPSGKFINDATVKITDLSGNAIVKTLSSARVNNVDGWVIVDNLAPGTYGAMVYKEGYIGFWKQTDCNGTGTTDNATIQNSNTENQIAGWQNNSIVSANQVTWCKDIGLKLQ